MPKFAYTATKEGKTVHGAAEAVSRDAVVTSIRKQGMTPIVVKIQKESAGFLGGFKKNKKVPVKDLAVFTRQLSTMISAGVPMNRSLHTLGEQTKNPNFKRIVESIAKDVEGGMPLADAMEEFPSAFSEIYVNMVRAGEEGGILDDILKRLALQIERDNSTRKKIKGAMAYPLVIMTVTIVAFFVIMVFIIPKIGKIITEMGGDESRLPIYTKAMLGISAFLQSYALFIVIFVVIFVIVARRYVKTTKGKYQFHALLLRVPILKNVIVKIAIARFSRTFASLMAAGVNVLDALRVTGGSIGNKVIQRELEIAASEVKNGKPLSEALAKAKHFPPIVSQMLSVGEESGQIDTVLVRVADFYEEEVTTTVDSLASIIEPVMIVMLGGIVGLIAASVIGPISNLSKNINSGGAQ